MTTFMHHQFDSPTSTTQASFEAFINQSPPTLSGPLMSDDFHRSDARCFSPQLPRAIPVSKFNGLQSYGHGQPSFSMDYSSSVSSFSTASSHNADSPRDSASSQSSVSPDLSLHDHCHFEGASSHQGQVSSNSGKLLEFDVDLHNTPQQPSGVVASGMWGASFDAHTGIPSHHLTMNNHRDSASSSSFPSDGSSNSPAFDAGLHHSGHPQTVSYAGALNIKSEEVDHSSTSWFQLSAEINAGHPADTLDSATVQPVVLSNPNPNMGTHQLPYNLAPHSAPASLQNTFDIQCSMPPQHLSMSRTPLMNNFSPNMIGQESQPWINSSAIPPTAQNMHDSSATPMMTPQRKFSLDQQPSPALLTSAFPPPGAFMPAVGVKAVNPMFTPAQSSRSAQEFDGVPSSAPANLALFTSQQVQHMVPSTPTRPEKGQGSNTVSMMAATASFPEANDTPKALKPVRRKRKADDSMQAGRVTDADVQAQAPTAEAIVAATEATSPSKTVRERKPLPKRAPPSASQKTEAGLPFPVVDTSVKRSTEFVYPDTTGLTKREVRLVKNRAAAFLSRQRKREQFDELEVRCEALSRLVWHMYGNMMGSSDVDWETGALQMGLTLPSSSSGPSSMARMQHPPQPQAPQALGLKLREENRTVVAAFEMAVKRKGATIGPVEGELPLEQGPPLGSADMWIPSHPHGEPRLATMHSDFGGDVEFDTDNDEHQALQLGSNSSASQKRQHR
ncbi:hypothetical protein CF319_g4835 [Tilletia indica]|nr:hypothetical protein CF319_g4835 [Tilletia indica]